MHYSLQLNSRDLEFIICILSIAAGFMAYYFISSSHKIENSFSLKFGVESTKVLWIVFQRMIGVLFFGIIPLLFVILIFREDLNNFGISSSNLLLSFYWIIGLSPLLITMNYFNCNKVDNLSMYPQIRKKVWTFRLLILSALTWCAYLLAYEFMFRGYLLFVSIKYLGVWPAIALNIAIYALVHIPKGIKEALGALPLGIVLGIVTVQTGNILVAFVVHVVLALSNEWLSLKAHPEMKYSNQ